MQEFTYHFLSSKRRAAVKDSKKNDAGKGIALTAVLRVDPDVGKLTCGISLCHRADSFNRKNALRRARGRAEAADLRNRRNEHCQNLTYPHLQRKDWSIEFHRPVASKVAAAIYDHFEDLPEHFRGLLKKMI